MTSIQIESSDNNLKSTSTSLINENKKNFQPFHHIADNRENVNCENTKHDYDLQKNKNSLNEINDTGQITLGISSVTDILPFESKITSVEEVKAINEDTSKSLNPDKISDGSKIYISCRFCKKGFETLNVFSSHDCKKKKNSSNIKIHKCKFCSLTFSQKWHLTTHIEGHTRNNCTLCNAQFTKRKALCKHLSIVHNVKEPAKLYLCSVCDKHFSKRLSLNIHIKSHHINNQFFCLRCCFVCDDEETYNDHMKQHVKISKHECNLCHKKFVRRQQYDQHMMAHERYTCSSCNITFSNKKLFTKHQHSVHHAKYEKKHACLICQKLFDRPKYLEIHQRVHTGEKPFKCFHCENNFSDHKSLLKHMKSVKHLQRVNNQKGQVIEIEKPFLCSKCGVRFYSQHSLLRHGEIIHSASDFLKCPHCDYKSKCKTNFKRHLELHTDTKRFVCELCGSSFRALATLKEHYVFVHSENREFICDICKKAFKNKSTLQRHMRIHNESRPYKCYCDRAYKRMSHLKRHMISAHRTTLNKNQTPMPVKENTNSNSSLSEESVSALMKSLGAYPDESSCDDFSVPHYIISVPNNQITVHGDFLVTSYLTAVSKNQAKTLNNLIVNKDLCKEQLPAESEKDVPLNSVEQLSAEAENDVHLNSVQKLPDNLNVYNTAGDSENTLNMFDLNEPLKIPPASELPNSETSSISLDDATLSLSPSNYCDDSSPLNAISMENIATLSHSVSTQDVHSLTTIDTIVRPQSSPNLNFETPTSSIDTSFPTFSNSDSPISLPVPPFSLNSSPSHVADLNSSQRQLFGASEDFLSLPSYSSSNEFDTNCSTEQFFSWDTDENSNTLKVCNNDLTVPNTCANMFSSNLTSNVNNLLLKDLFTCDSIDANNIKSELASLSNLC